MVGLGGFEPPTSPLSGVRSNQLSYRPALVPKGSSNLCERSRETVDCSFSGKEVIQPQVPLRLPCYDFTPVIDHTVDGNFPEGLVHRLLVQPTPMV